MAFSFSQPQQSLFQTPSQPQSNPFQFSQSTPNPFQQQQQQQQPQPLQLQQFQFQQPQPLQLQQPAQQPQQPQQIVLYTKDKAPAAYGTKWADLHPDSQKFLLQIEERILEYRAESQKLDQCSRLYDSTVNSGGFEADAGHILQELGGISSAMEREKILIQERMSVINDMMRDTEVAVRSFIMLRPRFLKKNVSIASTASATAQNTGTVAVSTPTSQPSTGLMPVFDFYTGLPKRPSPFLQNTVARFEKYLVECTQWIEELEQLLRLDSNGIVANSGFSSLQSIPNIMSNVHDYFVHVAAKVEDLHQRVESTKTTYLSDKRRYGEWNDPFLEADRREVAKQEAAARRVHPTLHLPAAPSQPSTQPVGVASTSATTISAFPPPSGTTGSSSGGGFSFFSTPSTSMTPSSFFTTPSSSAPTSSLFASTTGSAPLSTPFGSASTTGIGSSQLSSLFGSSTTPFSSPAFGSSPAFSTPFAAGASLGSGASFGGTSKSSRPKARSTRR